MKKTAELKVSLGITLLLSLILFWKYCNINPLIHWEKLGNLHALWEMSWYESLQSSCKLDACIARFRPLNYLLEFIDAIYLKNFMQLSGFVSWKPFTSIITIFIAPTLFLIYNKKNIILSLLFIAFYFSSFVFLSNYYMFFRPGKEFSLLFLIPILSLLLNLNEEEVLSSKKLGTLLVIAALLDEQNAFFLFFLLILLILKNRTKQYINSISVAFLSWLFLFVFFMSKEKLTILNTYNYLEPGYSSKIKIIFSWFYENSFSLFYDSLKFVFLNNLSLTIFVLCASLAFLLRKCFTKEKLSITEIKSILFFIAGIFVFMITVFFHPIILSTPTQAFSYYFIIPTFLVLYGIYALFSENFYMKKKFMFLLPFLLIGIVYKNLDNLNYSMGWVEGTWEESRNQDKHWDFATWQRGAQATLEANKGCLNFKKMKINMIENITFEKYICQFISSK